MSDNSGDDAGKVYDFKDSKTSGIVTVTKSWDDSSSNDERAVPDVSISTVEPSKLNRTYTITFHGNGMKFADGSEENTVIYNGSGQIINGTYKEPPSGFAAWYFDISYQSKAILNSSGLLSTKFINSVNRETIDLYAKNKTYELKSGTDINFLIPSTTTKILFTEDFMPATANIIDVDADGDGGVVAWMDGTVMNVSSQVPGQKIYANENCRSMFSSKSNITSISFNSLDTSNVTDMTDFCRNCRLLTDLDLSPLNTCNVTSFRCMFLGCKSLTDIDLSLLDTSQSTTMYAIFGGCSNLSSIDLTSLKTSKVNNMAEMFSGCTKLIKIDLSTLDTKQVTTMEMMFTGDGQLKEVILNGIDTSNVQNVSGMFYNCSKLSNLPGINKLNFSKVRDFSSMFYGCASLTNLDLSSFNTLQATNMSHVFEYCSNLTSLDLSSWDTNNVTDMTYMFMSCPKLNSLTIGSSFAFIGVHCLTTGTWYSSDGTAYTSTTIPNNKADTYTRR